jgi:hypothetical protein
VANRPQLQFSVAALLAVTTFVAVALGVVVALEIPFSNPVVQGFLAAYLMFFGIWTIIRGPRVWQELDDLARRRRELRDKRAAIERELRQIKESRAEGGGPRPPED